MADLDVYVISDHKFDPVTWIDSALTWGDVGVLGIRDMVTKLQRICANGDRIAELRIVGHGNELGQFVGRDWLCREVVRHWRSELSKMTPLFGVKRHVIMGGCRQGRNSGLLLALSNIWNVPVSGFTALQRPPLPGDEGGRTTCFITCTRSGYTFADHFDKLQLAVMAYAREAARYAKEREIERARRTGPSVTPAGPGKL